MPRENDSACIEIYTQKYLLNRQFSPTRSLDFPKPDPSLSARHLIPLPASFYKREQTAWPVVPCIPLASAAKKGRFLGGRFINSRQKFDHEIDGKIGIFD